MKRIVWGICIGVLFLQSGCISLGRKSTIPEDDLLAYSNVNRLQNDKAVLSVSEIFATDETREVKDDFLLKGRVAFDEGRYADAISWWKKILALDPKNSEVSLLISTAKKMKRLKEEQDEIARLNKMEEAKKQELKNSVEILKMSLSEAKAKKEAEQYLLKGMEYFYKQHYHKAVLVLKKGLLLDPDNEKLKDMLGRVKKRLAKITKKEEIDKRWEQKIEEIRLKKEAEEKKKLEAKLKKKKRKRGEQMEDFVQEKLDESFVFELFPEEMTKNMKEEFLMEKSVEIYKKAIKQFPLSALAGRALYKIANDNFKKGKYVEAKAQYEKILNSYFDSGFAEQSKLKSAQIDAILNNLDDAIYNTYNFIETFPNSKRKMDAYMLLGKFFERQEKYDRAEKVYVEIEDFVKDKKKLAEVYFRLAELYLKLGDLASANDEYMKVMEQNSSNKYFDKAQFLRANCLLKQGKKEPAAIEYIKIVRSYDMNPYIFESYKRLAEIYKADKDYIKATNIYSQMIKKFPYHDDLKSIYLLRANTFKEAKFYPKAIDSFLSIIQYYPKDTQGNLKLLFEIGMCFLQLNELPEAEQYFSQIIYNEATPKDLKFLAVLENAKIVLGRKEYEDALALYEKALALNNDSKHNLEILFEMAECYKNLGNLEKSIESYAKIYNASYDKSQKELVFDALIKSADCCFNEEKYAQALKLYDRIINEFAEFKKDAWSLYQKAKCYDKLNQIPKAVSVYEEVIKKYKESYLAQQAIWDLKNLNWVSTDKKVLEEKILN